MIRIGLFFVCLTGCAMSKPFSMLEVSTAFAKTTVNVIAYVPPKADPKSTRNEDVYAWLNNDQMPGSMGEDVIWVCASSEQAVLLAQKRSQALANTNMGDVYGGPLGWVAQSGTELKLLRAKAFVQLEPEKPIGPLPVGARRFVLRNVVLEAAPMPRDDANQLRAEQLVKRLETMR
jgi:hypothetical protein